MNETIAIDVSEVNRSSAVFDEYAANYEAALSRGLAISGENSEFFARARINWLARLVSRFGEAPTKVMDFGCGRGTAVPLLLDAVGANSIIGVDVSRGLLDVAATAFESDRVQFVHTNDYSPNAEVDLAYCNGVFHHIPPPDRAASTSYVFRSLRPGGLFALWENNPWNPGTRYVMSRIPFDRDAVTLSYLESASMLRSAGFQVLGAWFLFYFPSALRFLRPIERMLVRVPFGAQYCVLARRLETNDNFKHSGN